MTLFCWTQSPAQQKDQWLFLFNGKGTNELRGYQMDSFPNAWKIEDCALNMIIV